MLHGACHWNQRSYHVPAIAAYHQFRFRSSYPWRSHHKQRCYDYNSDHDFRPECFGTRCLANAEKRESERQWRHREPV
jgi:hypothetical protein